MTKDALLEIGSEELPASFIGPGMSQLKEVADASLKENNLPFHSIEVYGTPRRLAVMITGLSDKSLEQRRVIPGPPAAKAKDPTGQWTQAAVGFAGKHGLDPSDLVTENDRLCAVMHLKGSPARKLLSELFPQWIRSLQFPKTMIWEPSHFRYPRPIRWITALYGHDIVRFTVAGVSSGKATLGLGLTSTRITITHPGKYAGMLKNACVMVEPPARQEAIRKLTEQAVRRVHGKALMSENLLDHVSNLVEHPVAVMGNFDPAYLDLPPEVLITCLEHHQKFFPVTHGTDTAKLLPHFVGIRNGMSVHQEIVREGYERVLAARLSDARFFYNHDRKTTLASKVEALRGVMFQEKLGNLFEKKERVKAFLATLRDELANPAWLEPAFQVAELCKADLVTDMVREFPELQGKMARVYAALDGEPKSVSQALEQQYWPITLTGELPATPTAAVVSLADKLDTLAGDFAVGLIPSGSADPYGLRRAAVGVLRILEAQKWPLALEVLLQRALVQLPASVVAEGTLAKLKEFMKQRFAAILEERGYKPDEIDAVFANKIGMVSEALARLQALKTFRDNKEFLVLATVFKRSSNIVQQAIKGGFQFIETGESSVNEALFEQEIERELFRVLKQVGREVAEKIAGKDYVEALKAILPVAIPLDNFFKEVMVMTDKNEIRQNRLSMMYWMTTNLSKVADFSKLKNG